MTRLATPLCALKTRKSRLLDRPITRRRFVGVLAVRIQLGFQLRNTKQCRFKKQLKFRYLYRLRSYERILLGYDLVFIHLCKVGVFSIFAK
jgi:hypothetical protein